MKIKFLCGHTVGTPAINYPTYIKENTILFDSQDFYSYKNYYQQHDVSLNFQTKLWMVDQELIKFLHNYATHISIMLRNPYDFIERYFDWLSHDFAHDEFVEWTITMQIVNYQKMVSRWMTPAPATTKCKIFYFDDLRQEPELFFLDYLSFCDLAPVINSDLKTVVNANTKPQKTKINFSKQHIATINNWIDTFSDYIQQDMSDWKL